jgi:adenylate cyclase
MSENIFLQEMPATVAFFDVRRFSRLAATLAPMDLAVALGRFYRHVEQSVREHGGRMVKFISDAALTLFPSVGGADHAGQALRLVRACAEGIASWSEENTRQGLPPLVYSVGVATGPVLFGSLGTDQLRAFDALGRPVTLAVKLAHLATVRDVPHLVTAATREAAQESVPCIEMEGAEFGGEAVRLYRVLTGAELAQTAGD